MATAILQLDESELDGLEDFDEAPDADGDTDGDDDGDDAEGALTSSEKAALDKKKATEFKFLNHFPGGYDKNSATMYAEVHFTEVLKGTQLPGLRGRILHELLPLDLVHKVRRELGFNWQIDKPLPKFAPIQQIQTIIGRIRGFPLLTGFEFIGTAATLPETVDLTLRLHDQERRMQVTQEAFKELDSPVGEWCTLMGEHTATARRRKSVNATARAFSMPAAA
jgi:hypothetical protein